MIALGKGAEMIMITFLGGFCLFCLAIRVMDYFIIAHRELEAKNKESNRE